MTTSRKAQEPVEIKVEATIPQSTEKKEKMVEIVTKETFKVMIGDRWYFFTAGEHVMVSPEIKEYLLKQNALAVI